MTYCMSEVVEMLRAEGFRNAREYRIRYAWKAGHIPRPRLDASLRMRFSDDDIARLREYLQDVPKQGRKRKELIEA